MVGQQACCLPDALQNSTPPTSAANPPVCPLRPASPKQHRSPCPAQSCVQSARRIIAEWPDLNREAEEFTAAVERVQVGAAAAPQQTLLGRWLEQTQGTPRCTGLPFTSKLGAHSQADVAPQLPCAARRDERGCTDGGPEPVPRAAHSHGGGSHLDQRPGGAAGRAGRRRQRRRPRCERAVGKPRGHWLLLLLLPTPLAFCISLLLLIPLHHPRDENEQHWLKGHAARQQQNWEGTGALRCNRHNRRQIVVERDAVQISDNQSEMRLQQPLPVSKGSPSNKARWAAAHTCARTASRQNPSARRSTSRDQQAAGLLVLGLPLLPLLHWLVLLLRLRLQVRGVGKGTPWPNGMARVPCSRTARQCCQKQAQLGPIWPGLQGFLYPISTGQADPSPCQLLLVYIATSTVAPVARQKTVGSNSPELLVLPLPHRRSAAYFWFSSAPHA